MCPFHRLIRLCFLLTTVSENARKIDKRLNYSWLGCFFQFLLLELYCFAKKVSKICILFGSVLYGFRLLLVDNKVLVNSDGKFF